MSGILMRLLAKSGTPPIYLDEHTEDVEFALQQILKIWPDLPQTLLKAARFHDFGKAADGFQEMLQSSTPWSYRHEVLSAVMFRQCHALDDPDMQRAYLALLSHHKNFLDSDEKVKPDFRHCQSLTGSGKEHWRKKWNELNVPALRTLFAKDLTEWQFDPNVSSPADEVAEYANELLPAFEDMRTALCRGALVAADHVASAKLGDAILGENISEAALSRYAKKHIPNWLGWSEMQKQAGQKRGSVILTAPTGSGKTEAALLWALHNRKRHERVFFVLPYQVSINAMAERLSVVFPDEKQNTDLHKNDTVSALHSNTALAYLRSAMNDESGMAAQEMTQEQALKIAQRAREAARKIYSPLKITTVYQLLDIFFGRKFFEVGLLELTNSLVIFDEIHAYDGHTLGLTLVLLDCLRRLGARVFIMTATLPSKLNETLRLAAGIDPDNRLRLKDSNILSEVRRAVHLNSDLHIEDMTDQIRAAVKSKKRVAVVCNTVDKAIRLAEQLQDLSPMLIHSRFTIGQRAERETQENLRRMPFVISTQVIEVSIDVSFDVMFMELAPIDDLLQRFGRVNRHELRDPSTHGLCYIALSEDPGSEKIYGKELLNRTRTTLLIDAKKEGGDLQTQPLDYKCAAEWVERVYPDGLPTDENNAMCDSRQQFQGVVDSLKPMMDATQVDLEKNLFRSVQVVPARYALEWYELKKQKRHLEAKKLIVNVDERVWGRCCEENRDLAKDTITYGSGKYEKKQIIALFPYDEDSNGNFNGTGLRLDQNPVPSPKIKMCIFSNDED